MRRLELAMPAVLAILLGTPFPTTATPGADDLGDDPLTSFVQRNGNGDNGDGTKAGQVQNNGAISNLEVIAHNDIGNRGFNADIYAYKGFAYVGQWGFGISNFPKFCPSSDKSGVKVLDLRAPGIPILARLQNPRRTSAEDIVVYTAAGRDIAAVGIQACFRTDNAIPRGLQLFDVTDPRHPVTKGFLPSGDNIRGVHELSIVSRPDLGMILALQGVNYSETYDAAHRGGLRIANVTDASNPVENEDECQSNDSKQQPGWGFLRIFDLASRDAAGSLVQVGEFRTQNSLKSKVSNGLYSVHHTAVNATWGGSSKVAVSWYSDGVRILDLTPVRTGSSRFPAETAFFVPPAANDPVGSCACLGNSAFVWGVVVTDDGLIVISDMNSGVWVLRETR